MDIHKVNKGETLSGLSVKYYGNTQGVKKIMDANPRLKGRSNGRLSNEDLILTGETLIIPAPDEQKKEKKDNKEKKLTISVAGVQIEAFSGVKVADAFDCVANGLIFEVPNTAKNRKMLTPFKFNPVSCNFGNESLVNGQIFKINVTDVNTLQATAYNFSQHAVTCNLSPDSYPRSFTNKSLKDVADALLGGLGVKFKASKNAEEQFNKIYTDNTQIGYDQAIADFLLSLAQQKDLIIRPDNDTGGIIFDRFDKEEIILDLIKEKIYNNLSMEFNSEFLFSELFGIKPKTYIKDERKEKISNDWLEAPRIYTKLMSAGEHDGVKEFIQNEDKKHKKRLFKVNFNYPAILDKNNQLIKSGRAVILQNEEFYIKQQVKFLIINVNYDFDSLSCDIEAQPIEIFKGEELKKFWE